MPLVDANMREMAATGQPLAPELRCRAMKEDGSKILLCFIKDYEGWQMVCQYAESLSHILLIFNL